MKNDATGFNRLVAAFGYSSKGLKAAYQTEVAFRQEVWASLVLIPLALFIGDNSLERGLMIATVLLVLIVELINTAIEKVVDRIGEEFHELSGAAKDTGSAAVLIAMFLVPVVWLGVMFN